MSFVQHIESLESRFLFAAGDLDTSFDADGRAQTPAQTTIEFARAQVVQSDGKFVVVGLGGLGAGIARYNANGTLDTSFGADLDGRVSFSGLGSAMDVGVDSQGRIYVTGSQTHEDEVTATGFVLRLTPSGALDTTFSGDGITTFDGFVTGLAMQSDGKPVVCGWTSGIPSDVQLLRFTTGGALDTTFGGDDGIVTRSFSSTGQELGLDVGIQSSGSIVVIGQINRDVTLWRTTSSGTTLRASAINLVGSGTTSSGDSPAALAIAPDDSIFITGSIQTTPGRGDIFVLKLGATGSRVSSFGGAANGVKVIDSGDNLDGANAIDVQSDGKILIGGEINTQFAVVRLTTTGALDTTFSSDGIKSITMGTRSNVAGIIQLANGDIQLSGTGHPVLSEQDFAIARLNSSGFGEFSKHFTDFDNKDDFADDVFVGADDKAIVVGTRLVSGTAPFGQGNFALAQYNANGSLDTSFSGDGRTTVDFGGDDRATGVVRQADGKIIVVGSSSVGATMAVARFNTNGQLDTSFSGDGKASTEILFAQGASSALDVAIQSDGKIVIVGTVADDSGTSAGNFAILRLNANGSPDTSFSGDGRQIVNFGTNPAAVATSVAIQADGKIVVAGRAGFSGAVARLNTNGSPDNSFSGDGKFLQDLSTNNPDNFFAMSIQSDGRIVAGGTSGSATALARFNTNGTLDTTFDGDGIQIGITGRILDLKIQSDGKIVGAGSNQAGGGTQFRIVRFNTNGSPDATFSGDGLVDTQFNGSSPTAANAAFITAAGKLFVAGFSQVSFGNEDFAVARYLLA